MLMAALTSSFIRESIKQGWERLDQLTTPVLVSLIPSEYVIGTAVELWQGCDDLMNLDYFAYALAGCSTDAVVGCGDKRSCPRSYLNHHLLAAGY